MVDNLPWDAA